MSVLLKDGLLQITTRSRAERESPRDPRCKLAFQRICGTCTHYGVPLRPAAGEPVEAPCAVFGVQKGRTKKAWKCHRWARKGATL